MKKIDSSFFPGCISTMQPEQVDLVIYHDPCSDGTGAAFAAWKYNPHIDFYPTTHKMPPPNVQGRNVLICDFAYRKEILEQLIRDAKNLLIIDHHKSAEQDLAEIPAQYKIFDMNHSGAYLTWKYFFPSVRVPLMIEYIQDRDIWTNKLPNIDAFVAWFYNLPLEFEVYEKYLDDDLLRAGIQTGIAYREHDEQLMTTAMKYAVPKFTRIGERYYFVVYLNTTVFKSDLGHRLLAEFPRANFAAMYSISDGGKTTNFSLRSTDERTDVSKIAFSLGGGGHRNASGVNVNYICDALGVTYDIPYELLDHVYIENDTAIVNFAVHKRKLATYLLQEYPVSCSAVWHYNGAAVEWTILQNGNYSQLTIPWSRPSPTIMGSDNPNDKDNNQQENYAD